LQIELIAAFIFFLERSRARISSSVRSGSSAIRSSSHCSCRLSGERQWPVPGFSSTLPVLVQRSTQRIAVEAPILSRRAASRALSPSITIEITRALRSFEYPLAIVPPARCRRSNPNLICTPAGIPCYCCDSRQAENALADFSGGAQGFERGQGHSPRLVR